MSKVYAFTQDVKKAISQTAAACKNCLDSFRKRSPDILFPSSVTNQLKPQHIPQKNTPMQIFTQNTGTTQSMTGFNRWMISLIAAVFMITAVNVNAQTTLISATGDGGFETGATFALNNWTVVNHTTNTWQTSGVATPFAGTRSAFVSNDGGTTYAYTITSSQTSHFYRDITVPAGESKITLTFQWKGGGESGFDRLLVYTAPTSVTPVAGTPASSSTTLTGATQVFIQPSFAQTTYTTATVTLPASLAGTTFRLIFTWQNDASGGTSPCPSVDNISLTSAVPGNFTSNAVSGLWSATTTWVGGVVPAAGDNVTIVDGATVTLDVTTSVGNLIIGGGATGILQYDATARALTAGGNVTINAGARFLSAASGSTSTVTTHALSVGGNLTNNGTLNFSATAGAGGTTVNASGALITFTGAASNTFNVSGATLTNLRNTSGITLNKGSANTNVLTFTPSAAYTSAAGATNSTTTITVGSTTGLAVGMYVSVTSGTGVFAAGTTVTSITNSTTFVVSTAPSTALSASAVVTGSKFAVLSAAAINGATAGFLTITNGTFEVAGTNAISNPFFTSTAYSIPATGGFKLNNANATVTALSSSPSNLGLLTIAAGTYNIGTAAGNAMTGSTGQYNISGGTLNIGGRLTCSGAGSYTQSGGTVNVTTITAGNTSSSAGGLDFSSSTSSVTISAGTINLVTASTATTPLDFRFASSTVNITGGTLNVGTAATATNFNFRISGAVPNMVVDNTTNNKTATLFAAVSAYGTVTTNALATLNLNGFTLTERGTTFTNNGILTGTTTSSRLSFFSSAAQTLAGTGTVLTNIDGLSIQNTAGVTITHTNQIITLRVNLFAGTLTNSNKITLGTGAALAVTTQIGAAGLTTAAGSYGVAPTFNLGTGAYSVLYLEETAARTTGFEIPVTRTITNATIANANNVTVSGGALGISGVLTLSGGKLITTAANLPTVTATATTSVVRSSYTSGSLTSSSSGTTVTVGSTTGLSAGMTVTVTAGTGAFAANTIVTSVLTTTTFTVSAAPTTALSAATLTGAGGWVSGPVAITLPVSLVTGSTYSIPVGKGTYNPFDLVNPTTNAGGTVAVQAEVFDANSGGTAGTLLSSINTNRHWAGSITSGAANFTNTQIRLNDAPAGADAIGGSATETGAYGIVGGVATTVTTSSITSGATTTLPGFFVMGNKAAASLSNLAISPTGNLCTNAARTVTVTVTPGGAAVTGVTINYQVNGGTVQTVNMTNTTGLGGLNADNWSGVIPTVTPSNGTVTWSVTATDANLLTKTQAGTSYTDEPLNGATATATASISTVCAGSPTNLTAALTKSGTSTVGSGTSTANSSLTGFSGGQTFYGSYWGNARQQWLIRASELTALGFTAGSFTTLSMPVTVLGSPTSLTGFTIKMASTSATTITTAYLAPTFTTVWGPTNFTPVVGTNTHTFTTAFVWDGTSNVVVEVCHANQVTGSTGAVNQYSTPGFTCAINYGADGTGGAGACTTTTISNSSITGRPNMILTGNLAPAITSVTWDNGAGTGNPVTVSPSSTTTYTATVTASGCTKTSNGATVTVNPLPAAPSAIASSQCGTMVPTCFVSGASAGQYRWYLAPSGGTALAGETGSSLSAYTISASTTFYVSVNNGTCEGARTAVQADVVSPDAVTAKVNNVAVSGSICLNGSLVLSTTQTGSNQTYSYNWTAAPQVGSGVPVLGTAGASISPVPTTSGVYVYTVTATDGGCVTNSNVTVTVNSLPVINTPTATPATICAGNSSVLTATTATIAAGTVTVGTGTSVNTTTTHPSPFGNYYWGAKQQFLFTAAELSALGLAAGNITSVAFSIVTPTTTALTNYTIAAKATASTALTTTFETGLSTLFTAASYTPSASAGYANNTITFTTPFNWNGTSSIVFEICFNNASFTTNAVTNYTTATNMASFYRADAAGVCTTTAATLSSNRPNMRFGGQVTSTGAGSLNWAWNNGAGTGNSVTVTPTATTLYTVTATHPTTGCFATSTANVTVNQLPTAPIGTNSDQCGAGIPLASVTSGGANGNGTFKWYDAPTAGTLLQSSTSATYTSSVNQATDFYVSEDGINGCPSPRTLVQVTTSLTPDPLTITATPNPVCIGSPILLSVGQTGGSNTFDFAYSASPTNGSGLTGLESGVNAGVTPTAAGTFIYTVTGTDTDKGCVSVATVSVIVNPLPVITSAVASPTTVCTGAAVTLTAKTIIASAGSATVGTQSTTSITAGPYRSGAAFNYQAQYLFTAAELSTAGLQAGNITALSFNVTSLGSGTMANYTITIGTAASSTLSAFTALTSPVVVYNNVTGYTAVLGTNTHTFATAYNWDGTSNIIVQVCHNSTSGGSSTVSLDGTQTGKTVHATAATTCGATTGGTVIATRPVITFGGQVGTNQTSSNTWVWNPGAVSAGTTGIATVNPTVSTNYTATATNTTTGCSKVSGIVTVTVNPFPVAPTATPSTQCGTGVPTASVSGAGGTFKWYSAATGGTLLQTGGSTYTTSIAAPTHFYVSETSALGCEGPRADVFADVTAPPALTIAPSGATTFCLNGNVGLTAGGTGYVNFTWSANPSAGSGLSATNTAAVTATPTIVNTYVYTVNANDGLANGCSNTANVTVTVNPNPVISSATATPATVCIGGSSSLVATSVGVPGGAATIGTATTTVSTSGNPYRSGNGTGNQIRTQLLITKAQMNAAGFTATTLTSIAFNSTSTTGTFDNLEIQLGSTTATALTSTFESTAMTSVFTASSYTPVVGLNTHLFTTTFAWDGNSNILINICQTNNILGTNTLSAFTSPTVADNHQSGTTTGCTDGTGATSSAMPTVRFGADNTGNYSWIWNPGALSGSTVSTGPLTANASYTVTASNPGTGCSTTSSAVAVTVQAVGANATATPATICVGSSSTLAANATGGGPFTYSWSDGTTVVGTTATLTVSPVATTTYTVTVTDACSNSTTSSAAVTVNPLPTSSITVTGGTVFCTPAPGAITLNGTTNFSSPTPLYQWKLNGTNITGATSASYTVPSDATGTYTLVVTNSSSNCSQTSAGTSITTSARPSATATATPVTLCVGSPLTLTSTGTPGTAGYNVSSASYTAADMTAATSLVSTGVNNSTANFTGSLDDGGWNSIPLPFAFNFYGTSYTALSIATNGNLQFGAGTTTVTSYPTSTNSNGLLPATVITKFIAGAWMDAVFSSTTAANSIKYLTTGVTPSRKFIVEWNGPVFSGTDNLISQIVLNEGSNNMEVHFQQFTNNVPKFYSIGVQGTGTAFTAAPARNAANVSTATNEGWLFTPAAITNYSWAGPAGSGYSSALQNPPAFNVAAVNAGQYTVTVTDNSGCTGTASTTSVVVNPLPTITTAAAAAGVFRLGTSQTTALTYSATTQSPTTYSIVWDAAALAVGFTNVTDAALPASPILITVAANTDAGTYNGTLTVKNANTCGSNPGNAFTLTVTNANPVWTGTTSTNWNTGSNWSTGVVPAGTESITIDAPRPNYPVLTGNISIGSTLDIAPGATITIGSNTLTVTGGITANTGTLVGSNTSNLTLGATSTLRFATGGTLKNLNINVGTTTLANALTISGGATAINTYGTVTVANGAVLASNGNLTIQSNIFGTARVAQGAVAGNYITGDVTVERYIPANAKRAWRMLSVPTKGSQTIRQSWQENPTGNFNPKPGYGTILTSNLPNYIALGFDYPSAYSASIQKYNSAGNTWNDVTSTISGGIQSTTGYALYIRGDRSIWGLTDISATTLRTTGTLYTGDQTANAITVGTNNYELVGNLYASTIDYSKLQRTGGLTSTFYIWDPKAVNGTNLGAYQTFSPLNGILQGGYVPFLPGSYGAGTAGDPFRSNKFIESGQAFFVTSSISSGTIALLESAKAAGIGINTFRPTSGFQQFKTNLYAVNGTTTTTADGNLVVFNDAFSNNVDGDDVTKLANGAENLAIERENKLLVIEARQPVVLKDTVFFKMWNMQSQAYRLEFITTDMNEPGLTAYLVDNQTGITTPIDLVSGVTTYDFTASASTATNRFKVVFNQVPAAPLPVTFISISANKVAAGVKVDWKVAAERGIQQYEVERSADAVSFTKIGTVTATGSGSSAEISYNWMDNSPINGTNFYRIKSVAVSGEVKYTYIVKVLLGNVKPAFTISPNPVEGSTVNVQFKNQPQGRYNIRLLSSIGEVIFTSIAEHAGGSSTQILNLPTMIARGTYQLEIIAPDKTKEVQNLFINTLK